MTVLTSDKVFRKDRWFEQIGYRPHIGQELVHYQAARHRVLVNGRRWGKLTTLPTILPTPTGFTTMGEVEVGDILLGSDGLPCTVVAATHVRTDVIAWKLTFCSGEEVIVDEDHQWVTYDRPARRAINSKSRHTTPRVRTTKQIINTFTFMSKGVERANHTIHTVEPLKLPEADLPINPYLLGVWLGDGSSSIGRVVVGAADRQEMEAQLDKRGITAIWKDLDPRNNCYHFDVPGFRQQLRAEGLLKNKHIPQIYLRASIDQRRELLAGLLDTDGSSEKSRVSYTTMLPHFAEQVHELACSLGFKPTLTSRMGKLVGVEKQRAYRVRFHTNERVFGYERKRGNEAAPLRGDHHKHRAIVKAERVPAEPMRCIQVDSADSTYLIGRSMIVTHNTLVGGHETGVQAFVKNFLGEPKRGWIIGPQFSDAEKEFRIVYDLFKSLDIDKVSTRFLNNTENGSMVIKTKWGFALECRSAQHPDTLVGEGLDFVLLVEAGRHKRRMWGDYVRPALSDKRGWSLASGVPEGATENSLLYSLYQRGQDPTKRSWWSISMPSWTNTIVFPGGRNDAEILEAEDDLTEDEFKRQYGAEFVDSVGRVMKEWDDDVHIGDFEYDRKMELYAAVDYGYTNDWVWLWIQIDVWKNVYVIGEHRFQLRDTEDISRREFKEHPLVVAKKLQAIYGPPAEPDDNNVLQRTVGVTVRNNTGGEIKNRLALIRSALKPRPFHLPDDHPEKLPALRVDRSCTKLIWEMREGYRWPENRSDARNDSEIPLDKDNHGPEALGRFYKGHMEKFEATRRARQSRIKVRQR